MADGTKIEWTDATLNVVNGCSLASPGCTNCYAMRQAHRVEERRGLTKPSPGGMVWTGEVRFNEGMLTRPLHWRRPRMIFWNAHGDLFHEKVPDEWIDKCFAIMALTPHHAHQVLTKRADRMRDYCGDLTSATGANRLFAEVGKLKPSSLFNGNVHQASVEMAERSCLPNVWLGVSVEDQRRADERVPALLETPAAVRWLSMEPLLGPVNLKRVQIKPPEDRAPPVTIDALLGWMGGHGPGRAAIDWVVLGGESGPGARPMHPAWARSLRDQCADAGVPFLFKQWGSYAPVLPDPTDWNATPDMNLRAGRITFMGEGGEYKGRGFFPWGAKGATDMDRMHKRDAGRLLDGVEHNGYPAVTR